jgi:hypothetical protein
MASGFEMDALHLPPDGRPLTPRRSRPPTRPNGGPFSCSGLRGTAVQGILMNMDSTTDDRRPSQDAARLTPRERLERFAALLKQAMQLLAESPEDYRQYWARNLRQRSIHATYPQ